MKDEVSEESLQKLKNYKGWEVAKMNEQLYGIMAEANDGRAKGFANMRPTPMGPSCIENLLFNIWTVCNMLQLP